MCQKAQLNYVKFTVKSGNLYIFMVDDVWLWSLVYNATFLYFLIFPALRWCKTTHFLEDI